ncbi:MAG: oligosaccharide flippase family protein, partial [Verrucomicrobiota bacterium]|nr:oligosaccharide flippase family protein [Verrucomicrobiota bacterium]
MIASSKGIAAWVVKIFSGSRAAIGSSGADALVMAIQFLTSIITARALQAEGRGELTTILLWPMFFFGVLGNGFKFSILYHVAKFPDKRDYFIYAGLCFLLIASPVIAGVNFFFAEFALTKISTEAVGLTQLLGCVMPILLLANYAQTILQASRNFRIWNLIRVTDSFLFLVAVSLIFAFDIADITNVTVAFVACKCIILVFSGRYLRFSRFTSLDRLACRDMFVYMGKCLPTGWMGQANTQLDQMLLSIFFRPELLGLYRVAVSAANFMRFVPIGFQRTVLSQTAAIENKGSQMQHIFRTAKQGGLLTLIAVIPFFAAIGFFINFAYGDVFAEAVPVARVLVLAAAIAGLSGILGNGIKGIGKPLVLMYAQIGGLIVTAVGLPLLLPKFGILGAGITSLLAYFVTCVL